MKVTTWDHCMNAFKPTCLASIFFLTACAGPQRTTLEAPPLAPQAEQKQKMEPVSSAISLSSWELSGAIAARNSKKGWTASLNWLQQGQNEYQIRLFGPLGGGTVIIEKHGATITYRDGPKKITSTNASELLRQQTGTQLPVNNLYYWVRGIPAPGAVSSIHRDENNHLMSLNQAGYQIDYTGFIKARGMDLPSKIRLQGHGVLIKLVIKHWQV